MARERTRIYKSSMKKILLLEDDFDTQILFSECLKVLNYEVLSAYNGQEGLDIIAKNGMPDLIIMDLTLPNMTPEKFLTEMRKNQKGPHVPVLIISGKEDLEEKCRELKAQAFLKKPIDLDPFMQTIESLISAS